MHRDVRYSKTELTGTGYRTAWKCELEWKSINHDTNINRQHKRCVRRRTIVDRLCTQQAYIERLECYIKVKLTYSNVVCVYVQTEQMVSTESGHGPPTRDTRRWNWKRSFTTTATSPGVGASRWHTSWASPSDRSRSGSRTGAWSGRRTTVWRTRPPRRPSLRRPRRRIRHFRFRITTTTIIISMRSAFFRRSPTRTTFCRSTPPNWARCTAAVKNSAAAAAAAHVDTSANNDRRGDV